MLKSRYSPSYFLKDVPDSIKVFLKRAFFIFFLWKLLYSCFFFKNRYLDAPLTHLTSRLTNNILSFLYPNNVFNTEEFIDYNDGKDLVKFPSTILLMNGKKIISIADPCNALEIYVLFTGFLFCFPTSFRRVLPFLVMGVLYIYILNVLRCVFISIMGINSNNLINIAHHYLFKLILYGFVFLLWTRYLKSLKIFTHL